jgi:indole-3-acetate monooxygenase
MGIPRPGRPDLLDLVDLRDGPLYSWPGLFIVKLLGIPLGIARAAVDTAEDLLAGKVLMPEQRSSRDDPRVRTAVASIEAAVGAARSHAFDAAGDFWQTLVAGDEPSYRQRAAFGGSYVHVARTCRAAVEHLGDTVGSASIRCAGPIERHVRDLLT